MNRKSTLLFAIPLAVCAVLYSGIWDSWFFQDDFSWLSLNQQLAAGNLWDILTRPMAQGTWRPLSERAQFMILPALFGLDATPHHVLAFFTQFLNLVLLNAIVRKLSGSAGAGCAAASLWAVNAGVALPISWPSAYSQIECGAFLLGALWLWIRYAETGQRSYLLWQWAVFLLGFAVQELNVVYPAIALSYALLFAPRLAKLTLPLFLVSFLYALAHNQFAPKATDGVYGVHLGFGIFTTLRNYCAMALWPFNAEIYWKLSGAVRTPMVALLSVFVLAIAAWAVARKDRLILFGASWFFIVVSPFLLIPNQVSDYYLSLPVAGLAIFLSCAVGSLWRRARWLGIAAIFLTGISVAGNARVAFVVTKSNAVTSGRIRNLLFGVKQIAERYPGKAIVLNGIGNDLFTGAFYHHPFGLITASSVYIAPTNAAQLNPFREFKEFSSFTLPNDVVSHGINDGSLVVFNFEKGRFQNVTETYQAALGSPGALPKKVMLGVNAYAYLLQGGWYPPEGNYRWMGQSAGLRIGGPSDPTSKLRVSGFCAPAQLNNGPIRLTVSVNNALLVTTEISNCDQPFQLSFALKDYEKAGQLAVEFQVDKTTKVAPDIRGLGIAMDEIRID